MSQKETPFGFGVSFPEIYKTGHVDICTVFPSLSRCILLFEQRWHLSSVLYTFTCQLTGIIHVQVLFGSGQRSQLFRTICVCLARWSGKLHSFVVQFLNKNVDFVHCSKHGHLGSDIICVRL